MGDTATLRLALTGGHFSKWSRGLVADESLKVPLLFSGGKPGTDFVLSLSGSPDGVSFDAGASTVTFTGPATGASAAAATLTLTSTFLDDADVDDATVDVSIPQSGDQGTRRLIASGIAGRVKGRWIGNGEILLSDDDTAPPSKATDFSARAGNEEVSLAWSAPSNSDITGWQYRQKAGNNAYGNWMPISGSSASTVSHTVSGLTNDDTYTFQVRAMPPCWWRGETDVEPGVRQACLHRAVNRQPT